LSLISLKAPKGGAKIKRQCVIQLAMIGLVLLVVPQASSAAPNFTWDRAAYWDERYPTCWTTSGFIRDALEYAGYQILDADQLKTWMDARIADGGQSVVVFCRDIAPDTVIESMSSSCTLRQYLDAGGKIVWYADIPMYYQGHPDGTRTNWGLNGSTNVLGFNAAQTPWNSEDEVAFTAHGIDWGLTETWQSKRPTSGSGLRVLAKDASGYAAAWVKHYVPGDTYRGFVRLFDRAGEPNFNDVRRVAEYPHVPEPIVFDNQVESEDDIIGVFLYPWYENPNTSGRWRHWNAQGCSPPTTWSANYLPNYPDSTWNPSVQLYDSKNTEVLRWQDRAMARAGIDIAIASWWGIGGYEDAGLAKAIRTCKSVQWCIYYEMEAYSDPSPQKIYDDIKYVVDTYGPTHNYAKVDGKWLVLVYGARGEEAANRWRQAKAMLATNGYQVYLNGDKSSGKEPWDSVHSYRPVVYQGYTNTLPNVDDSAWISPGFWKISEQPRLQRSLSDFISAWNNIVANRERCRFILVETWNEWHEGTQIEPGQEIVPDPNGYYPSGYDYGYDFIDAIAPAAINKLHWKSGGHRSVVPIKLEAEEMIWDDEQKVLEESSSECRIIEEDIRIGSSIFVPCSNDITFTIRARAVLVLEEELITPPKMSLYIDDIEVSEWNVQYTIDHGNVQSAYQNYSNVVSVDKGIHKVEVTFNQARGDWDLIVDFVDINMDICISTVTEEGFETGDFSRFPWEHYGDTTWGVTSRQKHSGNYSAEAGSIDHDESTTLQVALDCVSDNITFYSKVSSESGCDYLKFYVDGVKQGQWSGDRDWAEASFPVEEGTRIFTWVYSKDSSVSGGSDTAWIDDIVLPVE